MRVENYHNVLEHRCSMTWKDLMNILTGKLFYAFITNMTAKPVNLPKFMIVQSAPNDPTSTIHT